MNEEIKLVIAIPTAGTVSAGFAYSLAGLVGFLTQPLRTRPTASLEVSVDLQESSVIHSNRELLVQRAIDSGRTHLLFLDDDMIFEPNIIEILLGRRQSVVACNYLIKTTPLEHSEFVAVRLNGRRIKTTVDSAGMEEIAYSGFGVSLFETRVFTGTPKPWFQPRYVPEAGCYTTEDNPCYEKIRAAGFPCYVDHDASKLIKHVGRYAWHWQQPLSAPSKVDAKPDLSMVKGAA